MINSASSSSGSAASSYRNAQPSNYIAMLLDAAKKLRLDQDPHFVSTFQKIALTSNQGAARKLFLRLAPSYYQQQISPDHFITLDQNLDGDWLIGTTFDGRQLGISDLELARHIGVFGQAGFGKSNFLEHLMREAKRRRVHCILFDRKGDSESSVRDGIDSIHWTHMALNPLCPYDTGIDIYAYRNHFYRLFVEQMGFFQRGAAIFLLGLDQLYKNFKVYENWPNWDWGTMQFPTTHDLLAVFKSPAFASSVRGQGRESLMSIIDKLTALVVELEPMICCQRGFNFGRLFKQRSVMSYMLNGLSSEHQTFVILVHLIQYYHYFNTYGPKNSLNLVALFDESKSIFGRQNDDKLTLKDLISMVREFGISLVAADQVASELTQTFFSNLGTIIFFRNSNGTDLQRLMYATGASRDQILANQALKAGEALVKTMKCPDLLRIRVPLVSREDKFVSREEVDERMRSRIAELHKDVISAVSRSERTRESSEAPFSVDEAERRFLECLASDFERPASEIYHALGLAESAGHRIKQRLLAKKLISEVSTTLGKSGRRALFLVPDAMVLERLGIALGSGRGKALHRHFQAKFKARAEELGFKAVIEDCADGTSEGPDLGLEKNGFRVAVEISITSKPSQEAANIAKNVRLGFKRVVLVFINRRSLEKTQQLASQRCDDTTLQLITFCMTDEFSEVIAGLRNG